MPFWAKSGKHGLSLLAHTLDTAAVAYEILSRESRTFRERVLQALGFPDEVGLSLIAALCGLHDLGKATPVFQAKWKEERKRLEAQGFPFPPARFLENGPHHGALSQVLLEDLLPKYGASEEAANELALALAAHHGFPPASSEVQRARRPHLQGQGLWEKAREELLKTVFQTLKIEGLPSRSIRPEGAALLMGITSVADWVASNEAFFPQGRAVEDHQAFFTHSQELARKALDKLSWGHRLALPAVPEFEEVFPFAPNALQKAVAKLVKGLYGPGFLLIEAPMGSGKTEAALYAHLVLSARGEARGLYMALPTQATGNAMFRRLRRFLESLSLETPLELQLQHGTAVLNSEYLELRAVGEEETEGVRASEWFSPRKRAMLAPYGVGTVDQALLSVLRVRHHFVRLFGLANRTVVIDEVHAYDAYTSGLIEVLVRWLRLLGASVIVMSATLSRKQRRSLLEAAGVREKQAFTEASYPRVTLVASDTVESYGFSWNNEKKLELFEAPVELEPLAAFLKGLVAEGGCVAAVVNTVDRAQGLYQALGPGELLQERGFVIGKRLPDGLEVYLFHARFPSEEREARERAVLSRFGKDGDRPERALLLATQVVEQSLDLDFDALVADLAPVDLLFQRAGRLHRHPRSRPAPHLRPRLFVSGLSQAPPDLSLLAPNELYYHYLLLATWWYLRGRKMLVLPGDLEPLVSAVYDDELPKDLPGELSERFRAARKGMLKNLEEKRSQALRISLQRPEVLFDPLADFLSGFSLEDEEESPYLNLPLTRLGEPAVLAVPVFELEDGLFFDSLGEKPVPLRRRLSAEEALQVFRRSVRLSRKGLVHKLSEKSPPWEKSPLVARARLLRLIPPGEARFGRLRVQLSPELGIVYEKEEIS